MTRRRTAAADIPAAEVARLRDLDGPGRLTATIETMARSGVVWVWGEEDDILFTEDVGRATVLPVFPRAALAEAEFAGDDPAEQPIGIKLDRFLGEWLPQLEDDRAGIAVFPVEDRIAATLTPDEFRSRIAAARR
jgi:hypothetical protein